MKINNTSVRAGIVIGVAALLAGCVASRLPPDSRGVSFPVRADSYLSEGIVVAPETVRGILPGMSKPEVRLKLGNPHFTEGLFDVHDWNYIFELPAPSGGVQECQFQVQFDAHNRVTATYWQTATCEAAAMSSTVPPFKQADAGAKIEAVGHAPATSRLLADLRFPFGRSDFTSMRDQDRQRLSVFAAQIGGHADTVQRVTITGYADRIGSHQRIYRRSQARAETIAKVFVDSGVDPARIVITAKGDAESLTACAPQPFPSLIACLAPDRRVTVDVQTVQR